jgi:phage-related protein
VAGNTIAVKIVGDASDLKGALSGAEGGLKSVDKAIDTTEGNLQDLATEAKETGDKVGSGLGEGADTAETRIMGLRDMIDGTAAIMAGPGEAGLSAYLQGWADLAGGVANTAAPALEAIKSGILTNVRETIKATGTTVLQIGKQIAAWAMMGVQSLIHAAKVAAAWLISMGPIILVAAAVIGLVVLIIKNWDKISAFLKETWEKIKRVAEVVWEGIKAAIKTVADWLVNFFMNWTLFGLLAKNWDKIKEGVGKVWDFVKETWGKIIDFLKGLPGKVTSAVSGLWDGFKNTFRSAINWVIGKWNDFKISIQLPSILGGGKIEIATPNIPTFQTGGVFHAPPGRSSGLALLHDNETVLPAGATAGAPATFNITVNAGMGADPNQIARAVVQALQRYERSNGPLPVTTRATA